jgi:hypothetical protein
MRIQGELRGVRRFGYRVSKENFVFLDFTFRRCLTPAVPEYFLASRHGGGRVNRLESVPL